MSRGKGLDRGSVPLARGKGLNPVSKRRVQANARRRQITALLMERDCLVKVLGAFAVPPCFGPMTPHEVIPRGRGGAIDDARTIVPVCAGHNTWLSQDVTGQRWGHANGLLFHAWEAEAFLEAGGVLQGANE